jgi:hypothetical protein
MTGVAEAVFRGRLAELQERAREAWVGREREAVIEIVRSADIAAYLKRFLPQDHPARNSQRLILDGVAGALACFLPSVVKGGRGLPFGPSTPELASWFTSMLKEFGKLAELQRIAALERYGLARSAWIDDGNMQIVIEPDLAESMDREAGTWLQYETMKRVSALQGALPEGASVSILLDATSGVQDGWFIRYDGDERLIEYYRDRAMVEVLGCSESEALAHDAVIGGRAFAEWRAICVAALGRVLNHIGYATSLQKRFPELSLRNLLTVPVRRGDLRAVWLEAGEQAHKVRDTIAHLELNAETIGPWQQHHEIPAPFYIDVGGGWLLLPMFGGLLNPICGLVRTMRLKHSGDWDKAVDLREAYFRNDIRHRFSEPRFLVPDHGMTLRRADGSQITDIDAAILDRETGALALVQLKWPDIFGLSPKERESRRLNLLKANEWVGRVSQWIDGRPAGQVAKTLGIGGGASDERAPVMLVIPRYTARFTLNNPLDARAAWASWPEVARFRIETGEHADPLAELAARFKAGGTLAARDHRPDVTYRLDGLNVHLTFA